MFNNLQPPSTMAAQPFLSNQQEVPSSLQPPSTMAAQAVLSNQQAVLHNLQSPFVTCEMTPSMLSTMLRMGRSRDEVAAQNYRNGL